MFLILEYRHTLNHLFVREELIKTEFSDACEIIYCIEVKEFKHMTKI